VLRCAHSAVAGDDWEVIHDLVDGVHDGLFGGRRQRQERRQQLQRLCPKGGLPGRRDSARRPAFATEAGCWIKLSISGEDWDRRNGLGGSIDASGMQRMLLGNIGASRQCVSSATPLSAEVSRA